MTALWSLRAEYATALERYLVDGGEAGSTRAYELGRMAITEGLGLLDLVAIHTGAMTAVLARPHPGRRSFQLVKAASEFFAEALAPFEMAHRGYKEMNDSLKELNETIQRRNEELDAANESLRASNKELDAFSYSVSHDLRAPLRAINGFTTILLQTQAPQLNAEAKGYLERVARSAEQMGLLIEGLLALSRLGRAPLVKRTVAMAELVEKALDQLHPQMQDRSVELSIGPLPVYECEPVLLEQVFMNLIGNALKYSGRRAPARIEVGCQPDPQTNEAVFYVKDNGAGFDMRHARKLFGVFQRLHRSEDYEGTGVGLAIVQRIVQRHGGRIWAEAEVDKGATFFFTLGGAEQWQAIAA